MLEQVLRHLNNYFVVKDGVHKGTFEVSSGTLSLDFLQENQYFRVVGSVFNDGVYKYPAEDMVDEVFEGEVHAMAVPKAVIDLSAEIDAWCVNNPPSAYTSEAFGGYSRTFATSSGTGVPVSWQDVFRGRLNAWRKL
jgi:hypothetical protein